MDLKAMLLELEQGGWQALVDGTGRAYWRDRVAGEAVVLGPGFGLVEGEAALDRISGATWSWFRLRAPRVLSAGDGAAVLTYRVIARRDFDVEYQAMVATTWVERDGRWQVLVHQQTPM